MYKHIVMCVILVASARSASITNRKDDRASSNAIYIAGRYGNYQKKSLPGRYGDVSSSRNGKSEDNSVREYLLKQDDENMQYGDLLLKEIPGRYGDETEKKVANRLNIFESYGENLFDKKDIVGRRDNRNIPGRYGGKDEKIPGKYGDEKRFKDTKAIPGRYGDTDMQNDKRFIFKNKQVEWGRYGDDTVQKDKLYITAKQDSKSKLNDKKQTRREEGEERKTAMEELYIPGRYGDERFNDIVQEYGRIPGRYGDEMYINDIPGRYGDETRDEQKNGKKQAKDRYKFTGTRFANKQGRKDIPSKKRNVMAF